MDSLTLELFRWLQSGPYDESGLEHIRTLLRTQRSVLLEQDDRTALAEVVELLQGWAEASGDPMLASAALLEASEIAEQDLQQPELATELRSQADEPEPAARNLPSIGAAADAALADRLAAAGDFDGAIEAYERALNFEANMDLVGKLAELYVQRGGSGDSHQAAELYCTLGDVLGPPDGLPMLELALGLDPDHEEARELLAQYRGPEATEPGLSRQPVPPLQPARPRTPASPAKPTRTNQAARPLQLTAPASTANAALPLPASGSARSQASALLGQTASTSVSAAGSVAVPPSASQPVLSSGRNSLTPPSATLAGGLNAGVSAPNPTASTPVLRNSRPHAPVSLPGGAATANGVAASAASTAHAGATQDDPGRGSATHPVRRASVPPARTSVVPYGSTRASSAPPAVRASTPPRAAATSVPPEAGRRSAPPRSRIRTPLESDRLEIPAQLMAAGSQDLSADGELPFPSSLSPVVRTEDALPERARTRKDRRWLIGTAIGASATAAVAMFMIVSYVIKPAGAPTAAARLDAPAPSAIEAERIQNVEAVALPRADGEGSETSVSVHPTGLTAQPPTPTPPPAEVGTAIAESAKTARTTEQQQRALEEAADEHAPPKSATQKPAVRMLFDPANLRGGKLNEQQLTAAIDKATTKIERCYSDVLEDKPRTKGRLTVGWTIKPNGRAAAVKKVSGTIKSPELTKCTLQAITNTRFPKPKKQAAQIKLPIDYRRS